MQKQIMRDYAKNRTVFTEEFERYKRVIEQEAWKSIKPSGWINRIIHAIAGKPIIGNWN